MYFTHNTFHDTVYVFEDREQAGYSGLRTDEIPDDGGHYEKGLQ